ncbi:MAG: YutD family protein [Bacilli bacterium]|nr:YutD family protein [Bacilli bacterium]
MIEINNRKFELIKDERNAFDLEEFERLFTDYFYDYDYIVGDIAYSKLRLKGFYDSKNKKVKTVNNIDNLQDYIDNYCAYGCRYFVLKCIK